MKYTIEGFNQQTLVDYGLNGIDAIILRYIVDEDGAEIEEIIKALPCIGIKNPIVMKRRINKYCSLLLLRKKAKPRALFNFKGYGNGKKECEWCHIAINVLIKHHFPIQHKNSGKKVVTICPNCHAEYHYYEKYIPTQKLKEMENDNKN